MKRLMLVLAVLCCSSNAAFAATCTPIEKGICHACKNCHSCKHCSKDGGKCSVCKKG